MNIGFLGPAVATVLTVYGIETDMEAWLKLLNYQVATVLTVYGIETIVYHCTIIFISLQQYLPFTVLKQFNASLIRAKNSSTVATVLTVYGIETHERMHQDHHLLSQVATVLTVYGIETHAGLTNLLWVYRCNSTYRLRY